MRKETSESSFLSDVVFMGMIKRGRRGGNRIQGRGIVEAGSDTWHDMLDFR